MYEMSSTKTSISKEFAFCYAHCIEGHPKCGRLHGHNAKVRVTVFGDINPQTGMILDFSILKSVFKNSFDAWDHRFLSSLTSGSPEVVDMFDQLQRFPEMMSSIGLGNIDNIVFLGIPTTAEQLSARMALVLETNLKTYLKDRYKGVSVQFWETPTSEAASSRLVEVIP